MTKDQFILQQYLYVYHLERKLTILRNYKQKNKYKVKTVTIKTNLLVNTGYNNDNMRICVYHFGTKVKTNTFFLEKF